MSKFTSRRYKRLSREKKFGGKIIKVFLDKVEMPNGRVVEREVVEHLGAVGIVPVDEDKRVILVRQYRHPIRGGLVEIPAGKLKEGEDPLVCAKRELVEEIGFRARKFIKLAEFYTTPGYSNEKFYLYLATQLKEEKPLPAKDEELELEVAKFPLEKVVEAIFNGEIEDAKTIAGLCLAYLYFYEE